MITAQIDASLWSALLKLNPAAGLALIVLGAALTKALTVLKARADARKTDAETLTITRQADRQDAAQAAALHVGVIERQEQEIARLHEELTRRRERESHLEGQVERDQTRMLEAQRIAAEAARERDEWRVRAQEMARHHEDCQQRLGGLSERLSWVEGVLASQGIEISEPHDDGPRSPMRRRKPTPRPSPDEMATLQLPPSLPPILPED